MNKRCQTRQIMPKEAMISADVDCVLCDLDLKLQIHDGQPMHYIAKSSRWVLCNKA